jgi:hypothetical protein
MDVPVTVDNFIRAESDSYFRAVVGDGGWGSFHHFREPSPIDHQTVIRLNRDTLYSSLVVDLDAGPVTVGLPEAGARFMSLVAIDEDHYVRGVSYEARAYQFSREQIGTRYLVFAVRTFVDPTSAADLAEVHALQDAVTVEQAGPGTFDVPAWDPASQKAIRDALLVLGETLPDMGGAFGAKGEVDPIRHLIGTAMAWGGNPAKEAIYLNVTPPENDGKTAYQLTVADVPVDGFWSISVYNADGYYEPNALNAYSLNNITAKKDSDGSVVIRFGQCGDTTANCLPIVAGWNYMVRLYRPRQEILDGSWTFPAAQPLSG